MEFLLFEISYKKYFFEQKAIIRGKGTPKEAPFSQIILDSWKGASYPLCVGFLTVRIRLVKYRDSSRNSVFFENRREALVIGVGDQLNFAVVNSLIYQIEELYEQLEEKYEDAKKRILELERNAVT